jgi:hypothetical protein
VTAPRQPRKQANEPKKRSWLQMMRPRHPNKSVSPNRMAGRYASVGVRSVLQRDPSTTPEAAIPATIIMNIRESAARKMFLRFFAIRIVFYLEQYRCRSPAAEAPVSK